LCLLASVLPPSSCLTWATTGGNGTFSPVVAQASNPVDAGRPRQQLVYLPRCVSSPPTHAVQNMSTKF
jgi:hypothetical protein